VGGTFAEKPAADEIEIASEKPIDEETPPLDPPANGGKAETPSPSTAKAGVGEVEVDGNATVSVSGVVLTPDGKPAAGATVRAAAPLWEMMKAVVGDDFESPMSETATDAQGRFSISFSKQPFGDVSRLADQWRENWKKTTIAASLKGYGPVWIEYEEVLSGQPLTLRLVEDVPIRGRVIDLEGRAVAGTVVKIGEPHTSKDEDLSAWLEGARAGELPWTVIAKARRSVEPRLVSTPTTATTNADGRFEIRGLGRERIVSLIFEGETVAHRDAKAVTRKIESFQRKISQPPFEGSEPVFGTEFTFTADPARTIEGVVRDAKTGMPLAGVPVESDKLAGYPYSGHRVLKAVTDAQGRFRLLGMPKGKGNRLLLVPNDEQPYFMREVDVPDPAGLGPVPMEIELHRGVWITGRVTDKETGAAVPGVRLHYLPFLSNEFAQRTPEFHSDGNVDGDQLRYQTKTDGTYRLVGLPGRAIVGANSVMVPYRRGVGYNEIDAPYNEIDVPKDSKAKDFDTYRNPINPGPNWPTMMREINPAADATAVTLDFQLDPGKSLRIRVVGSKGEPISGVSVEGLSWHAYIAATQQPLLTATNFGPNESRTLLFHHKERNVGRVVTVGPDEIRVGEIIVDLQPCATLVGRILNVDGQPVSGMSLRTDVLPTGDFSPQLPPVATDAEGRFQVTLLPGCKYQLIGNGGGFQYVEVAKDVAIKPGVTKDLGTVVVDKDGKVVSTSAVAEPAKADGAEKPKAGEEGKDSGKTSANANAGTTPPLDPPANGERAKTAEPVKSDTNDTIVVRGRVLDPDGKPFAGATVYALVHYYHPSMKRLPLGETRSGPDGQFEFAYPNPVRTEAGWREYVNTGGQAIVAVAEGFGPGLAWTTEIPPGEPVALRLVRDDVPVTGRVIDLEGRPVAGVKVSLLSINPTKSEQLDDWLNTMALGDYQGADRFLAAGMPQTEAERFPAIVTGKDGRFRMTGLGRERLVGLMFEGPMIAVSRATVVTRRIPPVKGAARKGGIFGADFEFTASPTRPIVGTVRDADTGAPLAGVTIGDRGMALRLPKWVMAVTDEAGQFRLTGLPKGITQPLGVLPGNDVPYFSPYVTVPDSPGLEPINVDIKLHRGVWISGRVTDKETGRPVQARMRFYPLLSNANAQRVKDVFNPGGYVRGGEDRYQTNLDGTYRLVGLPGKAIVGAECWKHPYRFGAGAEQIEGMTEDGEFPAWGNMMPPGRNNPNSMQAIDVPEGAESATCDLELDPGETMRFTVADADGSPVSGYRVWGRTSSPVFHQKTPIESPKFEAVNFRAGETRRILVYHESQNQIALVDVQIDEHPNRHMTIQLQPCATVTGRLLDAAEAPVAGAAITLEASTRGFKRLPVALFTTGDELFRTATDKEGRFRMAVVPAGSFSVDCRISDPQRDTFQRLIEDFAVKPGETIDLGDVRLKRQN
jgi:protocatechuate 3,4-dioxygenase beta subunit/5-hydroxyisourate hydrolase-like protein (transthyretin family)